MPAAGSTMFSHVDVTPEFDLLGDDLADGGVSSREAVLSGGLPEWLAPQGEDCKAESEVTYGTVFGGVFFKFPQIV